MQISFHGAAQEVTGSCHLVEAAGLKILLDCGMYQGGGKKRHEKNRRPFPFNVEEIDYVLLSHAHIDHSGRLPVLLKAGYKGPIICSAATRALGDVLLPDAGHIQEEDARWKIKRLKKKGKDFDWVKPLFTQQDARDTLERYESVPFDQQLPLNSHVKASFTQFARLAIVQRQSANTVNDQEDDLRSSMIFSFPMMLLGCILAGMSSTLKSSLSE